MSHYIVSFKISTDRKDYDDVYRSLVDKVRSEADALPWEETSSFFAFESSKSTSDVMHALYYGSELLDSKDILIVINSTLGEYSSRGEEYPNSLKARLGMNKV